MRTPRSEARVLTSSTDTLPRIETQDQFQTRLRQLFRDSCLSSRERDWLKVIFEKFSSTCQPSVCWNEYDLVEFMGITLPEELKPDLKKVGPLLIRCLQRLGSFPWHNRPLQAKSLDLEALMTAIVILLRRYEHNLYPFVSTKHWNPDNHWKIDGDTQQDHWLHKALFQINELPDDQVIVDKALDDGDLEDNIPGVGASDDSHLLQAHALISGRNKQRSGNISRCLPKLPSSRSQDLRGIIPNDEFQSLLKILLSSQLYLDGYGPEHLCADDKVLANLTRTVSNSIPQVENQPGISWSDFDSTLTTTLPNIFSALPRLFAPFILDGDLDHDLIKTSTKIEVISLIQKAFGQTRQLPNENVFDLAIRVKLATILPVHLRLQTAFVISTVTRENFNLDPIRSKIRLENQQFLLLIKGSALHPSTSDYDDTEIVIGAFLPRNEIPQPSRRQNACIFQVSGALQSFSCGVEEMRYLIDDGVDKVQIQIPGTDSAELAWNVKAKIARLFMPRSDGRRAATSCTIRITRIDLFGFTAGKSRLQTSVDNSFYVPDRAILPTQIWPLGQTGQHPAAKFSPLSIATSTVAIVMLYQLSPSHLFPSRTLPGLSGAIFDFFWNSTLALGTPFVAWNIVSAENKNSAAISIAIALGSALAVSMLEVGNLLLWGPIAAWWIAGAVLLSRDRWEVGAQWFRAMLAAKMLELAQNRFS